MDIIKAEIVDYLGKYEEGVLVLLSLQHNDKFSEATIYYSDKVLTLTVDSSVEESLGTQIEFWPGYRDLVISILQRVVPYNEIIGRLDEIDFKLYTDEVDENITTGEEIDEDDIETA